MLPMHTVMETESFRRSADALLSEDERSAITNAVSDCPTLGVVMEGTGGARKVRFPGRGKGKSGGFRVVTYYAADDIPVFLLDVFGKGEKVTLSKKERNELKKVLSTLADDYRAAQAARVRPLTKRA
jgi:hypothetical protein